MKTTIYIGIDPDIEKCGYAVWDKTDKSIECRTLNIAELIADIMQKLPSKFW